MLPVISILILTYNREEDALALLQNLKSQTDLKQYVGEILLLNNNSTTDYSSIRNFVAQNPDVPIKYIEHDKNLGVAGGRNFLIQKAQFPYLLVIDDDMVFPEQDAMKKLSQYFDNPNFKNENVAVITFDVYYFSNNQRQVNALPHKKFDKLKAKKRFFTYYFSGGAHLIKKDVFEQTEYYPEDFFYGMEEYDLSYRIIDAGYKLAYDNSVKVLHKESPEGRVTNKDKLGLMWYNKSVVAWRYLPQRYFYSTILMWGIHYLVKSKLDVKGFFKILKKIRTIRTSIPQQKLKQKSLDYLNKVEARLWY